MENNLDKLFRDKMGRHKEVPSPQAWQQLHQNLKSKKRGLWMQRISIAASIFLIAGAGFIGYRMLHGVGGATEMTNFTAPVKEHHTASGMVEEEPQEIKGDKLIPEEQQEISEPEVQHRERKQRKSVSNQELALTEKHFDLIDVEQEMQGKVKEQLLDEGDDLGNNNIASMDIRTQHPDNTFVQNTDANLIEQQATAEDVSSVKEKKSIKHLKIIYKANEDSRLVASNKETIINKGINKLTDFSDEYLLTEDRKIKLRNTKDDLLALNFGKLLNNSNKDLEN